MIAGQCGNIQRAANAEDGLFYEDSRFLSRYELSLSGRPPLFLSANRESDTTRRIFLTNGVVSRRRTGDLPDSLLIVRTQELREGFSERIEVTRTGAHEGAFDLELGLDADFEHIYFVKQSRESGTAWLPPHRVSRTVARDRRSLALQFETREVYRKCVVGLSHRPRWKGHSAVFRLNLKEGERWTLDIRVQMHFRKPGSATAKKPAGPARSRQQRRRIEGVIPALETDHPVLQRAYEVACQDLISLRIKATESLPDARAIAAGIPWYMALFGRDSLISSFQSLWVDPLLARGTLRSLAHFQGRVCDPVSLEAPGKILHEYRESLITGHPKAIPKFPYYGTVDATPLFVVVLSEYCRWTGDLKLARELWPNVERAMKWLQTDGDPDGDGFLEYTGQKNGLVNQGWKDSEDSLRFADGRIARSPIALVEVQGYQAAALRRGAELARDLGKLTRAQDWTTRARTLEKKIVEKYWMGRREFFAEALDHAKKPVNSLTSNPGHLLWCESIPATFARRLAARLFKPDLFSGYGIRTLGANEGGYNPISYHNGSVWPHDNSLILAGLRNYGLRRPATKLAEALLDALATTPDGRFPELFSGVDRKQFGVLVGYPSACKPQAWASGAVILILREILGLTGNALDGGLRADPLPITGMTRIRLCGLRFQGRRIEVDARLRGRRLRVAFKSRAAGQ